MKRLPLQSFLAQQIQDYLSFQAVAGRRSTCYDVSIYSFDRYCAKKHPDATELTQDIANQWFRKRDTETNNSCRARSNGVKSFIRYLRKRGLSNVQDPILPKRENCTYIPHAFINDELQNFFCECDNIPKAGIYTQPRISRSRQITVPVFFRLLYSTGMRPVEARTLLRTDVNLNDGVISIRRSKGDEQHFVVMHDIMNAVMKEYDEAIEKIYPDRTYFFPANSDSYYSDKWVDENFKLCWYKRNHSYATTYDLRHNYATENINRWICCGFDFLDKLLALSKSMGHVSLENTKYYYSLVPALANILQDRTLQSFNEIVPEVQYEIE